jgi:hypothetical protein
MIEVGQVSVPTVDFAGKKMVVRANPGNGLFQIDIKENANRNFHINDLSGKTLMSGNIDPSGLINCTTFSKGVYILSVESEGEILTEKLVIQ